MTFRWMGFQSPPLMVGLWHFFPQLHDRRDGPKDESAGSTVSQASHWPLALCQSNLAMENGCFCRWFTLIYLWKMLVLNGRLLVFLRVPAFERANLEAPGFCGVPHILRGEGLWFCCGSVVAMLWLCCGSVVALLAHISRTQDGYFTPIFLPYESSMIYEWGEKNGSKYPYVDHIIPECVETNTNELNAFYVAGISPRSWPRQPCQGDCRDCGDWRIKRGPAGEGGGSAPSNTAGHRSQICVNALGNIGLLLVDIGKLLEYGRFSITCSHVSEVLFRQFDIRSTSGMIVFSLYFPRLV